jgi:hypothetical protein
MGSYVQIVGRYEPAAPAEAAKAIRFTAARLVALAAAARLAANVGTTARRATHFARAARRTTAVVVAARFDGAMEGVLPRRRLPQRQLLAARCGRGAGRRSRWRHRGRCGRRRRILSVTIVDSILRVSARAASADRGAHDKRKHHLAVKSHSRTPRCMQVRPVTCTSHDGPPRVVVANQLRALPTRNLRRPRASCSLPDIGTPTTDTLEIFDTTGITGRVGFRR